MPKYGATERIFEVKSNQVKPKAKGGYRMLSKKYLLSLLLIGSMPLFAMNSTASKVLDLELILCAADTPTEVLNIINNIINNIKRHRESMDAFGEKLKTWNLESPKERVAALYSLQAILSVGYDAAEGTAVDIISNAVAEAIVEAADSVDQRAEWSTRLQGARTEATQIARKAAKRGSAWYAAQKVLAHTKSFGRDGSIIFDAAKNAVNDAIWKAAGNAREAAMEAVRNAVKNAAKDAARKADRNGAFDAALGAALSKASETGQIACGIVEEEVLHFLAYSESASFDLKTVFNSALSKVLENLHPADFSHSFLYIREEALRFWNPLLRLLKAEIRVENGVVKGCLITKFPASEL